MKKKDLISLVQQIKPFKKPKIELEQYTIDAVSAVDIAYIAGFKFNDIKNRLIFDLGAGTGRISIALAFLQAQQIISIDIDSEALEILKENIENLHLTYLINPVCADIQNFNFNLKLLRKQKITTIMNPPFGVQKKFADRPFLEKALLFSDVVYSIHLANPEVTNFIKNFLHEFKDWIIDQILPFEMILERTYPFHEKKRKIIEVNVFRIVNI
jgi:putative methylase